MFLLNLILFGILTVWAWDTSVKAFASDRPIWGWFSLFVSAINGASFAFELWTIL